MHGIIFAELRKFVEGNHDHKTWVELLKASGFDGRTYYPNMPYPDSELVEIVSQASIQMGVSKDSLLESFGKFIVKDLLVVFKYTLQPDWNTLDLIENVETVIHKAVRINNKGAQPPKLTVSRVSQTRVEIVYQSPRKMEHLGVGIIKGIADSFKEKVRVGCETLSAETTLISVNSVAA